MLLGDVTSLSAAGLQLPFCLPLAAIDLLSPLPFLSKQIWLPIHGYCKLFDRRPAEMATLLIVVYQQPRFVCRAVSCDYVTAQGIEVHFSRCNARPTTGYGHNAVKLQVHLHLSLMQRNVSTEQGWSGGGR